MSVVNLSVLVSRQVWLFHSETAERFEVKSTIQGIFHGLFGLISLSGIFRTARSNTSTPAVIHSGFAFSTSLWLIPSIDGTRIIEVGATLNV